MNLSLEEIKYLCERLQKTYEEKTGNTLIIKTSPRRYKDLSIQLGNVKAEWLAKLFSPGTSSTEFRNLNDHLLDACCAYMGYATARSFFTPPDRSDVYLDTYQVFWTDTITVSSNPEATHRFNVTIGKSECALRELEDEVYTYKGAAPVQKKDTLCIELSKDTEKVFFLLNIGAVNEKDMDYIPGIFASGDRANIHPCSAMSLT